MLTHLQSSLEPPPHVSSQHGTTRVGCCPPPTPYVCPMRPFHFASTRHVQLVVQGGSCLPQLCASAPGQGLGRAAHEGLSRFEGEDCSNKCKSHGGLGCACACTGAGGCVHEQVCAITHPACLLALIIAGLNVHLLVLLCMEGGIDWSSAERGAPRPAALSHS